MKIIIGLGNPDKKYKNTRHNIGEKIVSFFGKINNFPNFQLRKKLESLISEKLINQEKIILALPQTFMNESGRAVKKLVNNYNLSINNVIIVHDDIDLVLGKIRIKKDGSSGGHNGIKSIIDCLNTTNFNRIKIGVANEKRRVIPAEKFVLENFYPEEKNILEIIKKKSAQILINLIDKNEIKETTISVYSF